MIKYAEEVLISYPISNPVIEFITHNENITFKVTDGINNKEYLLRMADFHSYSRESKLEGLHRPVYGVEQIDIAIEELKYGVVNNVYSQHQYEMIVQVGTDC